MTRRTLLLVLLASGAARASAQTVAMPAEPAPFVDAFIGSIALGLGAEPFYGSSFLQGLAIHLDSVLPLPNAPAVKTYLQKAALGEGKAAVPQDRLRLSLGRDPLPASRAAALLLANALARPDQFSKILDGLETAKPGLGIQAARMLREADGKGKADPAFERFLHEIGRRVRPQSAYATYNARGELDTLFDGTLGSYGGDTTVSPSYPPGGDGKPRPNALVPYKP